MGSIPRLRSRAPYCGRAGGQTSRGPGAMVPTSCIDDGQRGGPRKWRTGHPSAWGCGWQACAAE
eukprot:2872684-Pyramimonas_sp.AAC.1